MKPRFHVSEVFEMAIQMERNGAAFYRRAAELHAADPAAGLLRQLATMEDEHVAVFLAMQADLPQGLRGDTVQDPYLESQLYLHALADGVGGEGAPKVRAMLNGKESLDQILQTAIALEEQTVLFYLGLRELLMSAQEREHLDRIIGEERRHVAVLTREWQRRKEGRGEA